MFFNALERQFLDMALSHSCNQKIVEKFLYNILFTTLCRLNLTQSVDRYSIRLCLSINRSCMSDNCYQL